MRHPEREVRARYDAETLTVYQAFSPQIADAALAAGRFVPPFSTRRMTWIKPSFLWLMARSNWARRPGQERVLAVRLRRAAWDAALDEAVLTSPEPWSGLDGEAWARAFAQAPIHAQWDPERGLRGDKLGWRSLQVGVSRRRVEAFVDDWVVGLADETPRVRKLHALLERGRASEARRHLPTERPYPVRAEAARRLGISTQVED